MSQPGSSRCNPEPTRYSLQVIRIEGIPQRLRKGHLYVEIKVNDTIPVTVHIGDDGRPTSDTIHPFSQPGSSSVFNVSIKQSKKSTDEHLLGRVEIGEDVSALLQESFPCKLSRDLAGTVRSVFGKKRPVDVGTIHLLIDLTDAWERAQLCVNIAERRVEDVKTTVDKVVSTDSAISTVIQAVDQIMKVMDAIAEIHPVLNLSWRAASAMYKVISHQFEKDAKLLDLVDKTKDAFHFSAEARTLDDRTESLFRSKLKNLLEEAAESSRFVQKYAAHSFAGRIAHWLDGQKIGEYTERIVDLRKELDSLMIVNIGKGVDNIEARQLLETLVDPSKMDISKMSTRARCLEGTRESYVKEILSILLLDANKKVTVTTVVKNFVWLTGAAGVGKSTIALTIADTCDSKGFPAAYLFFERGKDEYLSAVRAIAYKLSMLHPSVRPHIASAVKSNNNISGSPFKTQFEKLVLGPIRAAQKEIGLPIIIILDALDECGTMSQRKDLVRLLMTDFAGLPPEVRVLVTSRPEGDITETQLPGHFHHVELKHRSEESRHDVDLYIEKEMTAVVKQGPPKGWTWKDICEVLSGAADGLFIWASTAVKMVGESSNPRRELRTLLEDIQSVGGGIDSLYATVLEQSGISWHKHEAKDEFAKVVGVVLFAKEAMSGEDIEAFLGLEEDTADAVLCRLRSVLTYESGKPVRLHHASFADYLTSERSNGKPWNIDEASQRQVITKRCFDTMKSGLRFNICNIRTSFLRNSEVSDLQVSIEKNILPCLNYASRFWAVHLCELLRPNCLMVELKAFATEQLLYWFEVLSLTNHYNRVAVGALYNASLKTASIDSDLSSFLWAAYRLASVFAYPISQSATHIYISALSLWRGESRVADYYSGSHPTVYVHRCGRKTPAQCIKILQGHSQYVDSVVFSSDGKRIASSADDCTIRIWHAESGELVAGPFEGHSGDVNSVVFSPDGERVISGSHDRTIRVWDVDSGELSLGPLEGHTGWVWSVAISRDGKRIASGSEDTTIRIWDAGTGKPVGDPLRGHTDQVNCVAFSPSGELIASCSDDKTIRVWSSYSGRLVAGPFEGHTDEVWSVAFSPDARFIASGSKDTSIRIWDAYSGDQVALPIKGHTHGVRSVAYSPDGKRIASGAYDSTVCVWNANRGELVAGPFKGHTDWIRTVAFSLDGKRIVSGSEDKTIRIWDAESGKFALDEFQKHSDLITSIALSPDGKYIASGSEDQAIRVWDIEGGELVFGPFKSHSRRVHSVAFSPEGKRIASGSGDSTVCIWDVSTGELVFDPLEGHTDKVLSVVFSPDGKLVASCSADKTIRVWSTDNGELVSGPFLGHTDEVNSISMSPDGRFVASGSDDKTIRVWDVGSGKLVSGPFLGHAGKIWTVAYSPDGEHIASGSGDNTIRVWNADTGELFSGPFKGHIGEVNSVAFSPNGRYIASGSDDMLICIWAADSGQLVWGPTKGHSYWVSSVAFSPDGKHLVSGSFDKTIRVWDIDTAKLETVTPNSKPANVSSRDRGPSQSKEHVISNWTLSDDGWVVGPGGEVLIWIPEDMRLTLCRPRNTVVIGQGFSTRLDLANSLLGEEWGTSFSSGAAAHRGG